MDPNAPEITAVRAEHRLDETRLEAYLREHVAGFPTGLEVRQFEGGQSNPTYLLEAGGQRWVMRKKPPGELLKSAHAVEREFRVMAALQDTDVPVPRMDVLCEDEGVIGTPFFVMEWVDGRIIMSAMESQLPPRDLHTLYMNYIDVLARLHSVDYQAAGLADFGRPGNYFARQVRRWSEQYRAAETDPLPDMDALMDWLGANIPDDDTSTIVHGDYTIRNVVTGLHTPEVEAVLDWELSTIGHPLGDLAYACQSFYGSEFSRAQMQAAGIPEEQALIDAYCERTGRSGVDNWAFYIAFCKFRLCAICQGVYKRGLDGNASSATALEQRPYAENAASTGWAVVNGA
ncbi:MAG: phosphotransferase family protein [Pseudomonadota bacterium]